jgi:endonuclease-3 related protein
MNTTPFSIYKVLYDFFGKQDWWPVDTVYHEKHQSDPRFEIIIGTILTQNTAWSNVVKALEKLKNQHLLDAQSLLDTDPATLASLIQSSGYFNQKTARLKDISHYLIQAYQGQLSAMFSQNLYDLRQELLSLKGIGPETADSILLYAGHYPVFVVDAYTKRLCQRLPFHIQSVSYDEIQCFFQDQLKPHISKEDLVHLYKQYHALIVELAKQYCKKKPRCDTCPLRVSCSFQKIL